jgi:hypothetical protein
MIHPNRSSGHAHSTGRRLNTGQNKALASHKFTGQKHGKRWWFHGRNGHHWSRTGWSHKYNRQCYWNADTGGWYYFDDDQDAYRPLEELDDDAPAATAAAPTPPGAVPTQGADDD